MTPRRRTLYGLGIASRNILCRGAFFCCIAAPSAIGFRRARDNDGTEEATCAGCVKHIRLRPTPCSDNETVRRTHLALTEVNHGR